MSRRRHAEIAGAGLAGLTLAAALAQRGCSVCMSERCSFALGVGTSIWENGHKALEAVGALAEVMSCGTSWLFQIAHLSTWFRCIAVDIPGYGRSPKTDAGLTLGDIAKAAAWLAVAIKVLTRPSTRQAADAGRLLPNRAALAAKSNFLPAPGVGSPRVVKNIISY